MNERTVADLKKFIAGAISQQTFDLRQDMSGIKQDISVMKQDIAELKNDVARVDKKIDDADSRLSAKIDSVDHKLSGKLDDLSASVAEALYVSNEAAGKQFKNHERRIARLEHKPA